MRGNEKEFIEQNIDIFCCPNCNGSLNFLGNSFACSDCGQSYQAHNEPPVLFWQNELSSNEDVTEKIRLFYEQNPFPNYDDFDNIGSLIDKARKGLFAALLDEQIPFGARILECGCGTGQLTNFLSIANRVVIGTDICRNSLMMAQEFKNVNNLDRAHFYQMNLFRPCFRPQSFDLVISNGVLHHTSDPFLGFKSISALVKPGGYILVGLYHKYGRIMTNLRQSVFGISGNRLKFLDPRAIHKDISPAKRNSWFMDQYKNPHESKHTVGEVLRWLEETGFAFIHSLPKTVPFEGIDSTERLFDPDRLGGRFERFIVNLGMIFSGHKEGGFFIIIAQKPRT